MVGRANSPCGNSEKFCYVTLTDRVSYIYFSCAEHPHDGLMHTLSIVFVCRFLTLVGLSLSLLDSHEFKVKLKFTSIAVDKVLATWVSVELGHVI